MGWDSDLHIMFTGHLDCFPSSSSFANRCQSWTAAERDVGVGANGLFKTRGHLLLQDSHNLQRRLFIAQCYVITNFSLTSPSWGDFFLMLGTWSKSEEAALSGHAKHGMWPECACLVALALALVVMQYFQPLLIRVRILQSCWLWGELGWTAQPGCSVPQAANPL